MKWDNVRTPSISLCKLMYSVVKEQQPQRNDVPSALATASMGDTLRRKRKGTFTASYEHLKHLVAPEHYNMRVCSLKANYIKLQLWGGEIVVDGACVGSEATTNIKIYASRRESSLTECWCIVVP